MRQNELDALGVTTDLRTACKALGIGKSTGYELAKAGEFPTRLIKVGHRYVVPVAELKALLGLGDAA